MVTGPPSRSVWLLLLLVARAGRSNRCSADAARGWPGQVFRIWEATPLHRKPAAIMQGQLQVLSASVQPRTRKPPPTLAAPRPASTSHRPDVRSPHSHGHILRCLIFSAGPAPVQLLAHLEGDWWGNMNRRFTLLAAIVTCPTALALALPNAASAGQETRHPAAAVNTSTEQHPFKIKAGKRYDVVATLSGVRRHDRLAFEAYYRTGHVGPKRWHVLGSWQLHRGERRFRGAARATIPGLWTLRVQFLRHHRLLRGSQSNRFYVRVLSFKIPVHIPRKPKHGNGVSSNGIVIPNWTDVYCAYPNSLGTRRSYWIARHAHIQFLPKRQH